MYELYYTPTCPYCKKVIAYLKEHDISYNLKDVNIKENYEQLLRLGQVAQVPFFVDTKTENKMYDSDKIIEYIKTQGDRHV